MQSWGILFVNLHNEADFILCRYTKMKILCYFFVLLLLYIMKK
nr:MAG TPA: hypothetical protein [Caudoviricetes sp.]